MDVGEAPFTPRLSTSMQEVRSCQAGLSDLRVRSLGPTFAIAARIPNIRAEERNPARYSPSVGTYWPEGGTREYRRSNDQTCHDLMNTRSPGRRHQDTPIHRPVG